MNDIHISIRNLHKRFGNKKVLQGIDLEIQKSRSLVILGGSGTGKSVLIKTIVGLIKADSGQIAINGIETQNMSSDQIAHTIGEYGFLFQNSALFDSMTVADNIMFKAINNNCINQANKRDIAASKLKSVGLSPDICDLYPVELSGGMQKRVSLARAIALDPSVIFFDEPTTGLDPIMANVINDLIIKIQEELKATTITITHDMHSSQIIAHDIAFMYQGKILWTGDKNQMLNQNNPYLHQFVNGLNEGPIALL